MEILHIPKNGHPDIENPIKHKMRNKHHESINKNRGRIQKF